MGDAVLYGRMELRLTEAEKRLARFQGQLDRSMGAMELRTQKAAARMNDVMAKSADRMSNSFAAMSRGVAVGLSALGSVAGLKDFIDTYTRAQNALKVAGLQGAELKRVYDALFASAQKNAVPIETMTQLYGRLAVVQKELNVSSNDIIAFADNIGLALRVAGTDAQTASGALTQLAQALGAGTVRAEEFQSIQEGAPTILQAAARGIKEAGGSVAQLRKIMLDGKLSSEALFRGFLAGSRQLETQAANAVETFDQAFVKLRNAMTNAIGEMDETTGASRELVAEVGKLAGWITGLSGAFGVLANGPIGAAIAKLRELQGVLDVLLPSLNAIKNLPGNVATVGTFFNKEAAIYSGTESKTRAEMQSQLKAMQDAVKNGTAPNVTMYQEEIKRLSSLVYGTYDKPRIFPNGTAPAAVPGETKLDPISIKSYPVLPAATKPGAHPGSSSNSGASQSLDQYNQALEATNKQTAALTAETAAMSKLNPLIEDHGFELERVKKEQELLNAAKEAGKPLDAATIQQIQQTATAYAGAQAAAKKLADEQQNLRDAMTSVKDIVGSTMTDIRSAMEDGKITASEWKDVLISALNRVADKLQELALNSLFSGFLGGGSAFPAAPGGGLAALLGFKPFKDGGYTGPGGKHQPAGIVHRGEYVFDQASVKRLGLPNLEALRGYANGGLVGMTPRIPNLAGIGRAASGGSPPLVMIGVDDEGSIRAYVERQGRAVEARVAKGAKATFETYRKNQLHADIDSHIRSPRRRGSI